jgi:hypothetical protein
MRGAACPYGAGVLTTTTGAIAIPPTGTAAYANNVVCEYRITTGAPIYLRFDSFATEADFDFVKVYDGTSGTGTLKGAFSGAAIPPIQVAASGSMFIRFMSDRSSALAGVSMTWSADMATLAPTMSAITRAPTARPSILPTILSVDAASACHRTHCTTDYRLLVFAGSGVGAGVGHFARSVVPAERWYDQLCAHVCVLCARNATPAPVIMAVVRGSPDLA